MSVPLKPRAVAVLLFLLAGVCAHAGTPREMQHCVGVARDLSRSANANSMRCLLAAGAAGPLCAVAIALVTQDQRRLQECLEWPWHGPSVHPDADGDGVIDALDGCPSDPDKSAPGWCGCGQPDSDNDGDGVPDCLATCPGDDEECDDPDDDDEDQVCTPIEIAIGACH